MVELKPNQFKVKNKPSKAKMIFYNPVFERVVTIKQKDEKTKYVVTEWTVKLRCGHFFNPEKEQEIYKQYEPLQEGQVIKSLTVMPSGKYFNLVDFDLGEEPNDIEGSSEFKLNSSYLVCLVDDVYPIDNNALKTLKKQINRTSKKKITLEKLKKLLDFRFSNNLGITFKQIGYGYHFLPVSWVLKLFKAGFEQFCTVVGLVYPNGDFVKFNPRPINYETLIKTLNQKGVLNV